jgi:hypothetical protein
VYVTGPLVGIAEVAAFAAVPGVIFLLLMGSTFLLAALGEFGRKGEGFGVGRVLATFLVIGGADS